MKIVKSISSITSGEIVADMIVEFIQDKKGKDIIQLNLTKIPEAVADYFIICHADSTTQVRAIIDYVEHELIEKLDLKNIHVEGRSNGEWALADMGDIVVHVFQTEKREFYQLEDLWSDAGIKIYENL